MSGSNEKKDILSNVYFNDQPDISVDIDYLIGSETNELNWTNTSREIPPFNTIRVFDSSYLIGLLSKREIDSTLVEPFGLHLFSYIIKIIDSLKKNLENDMFSLKFSKPIVNTDNFLFKNKDLCHKSYLSDLEQKRIESKFVFSDEDNKKLESLVKKHEDLCQQNIKDKIIIEKNKSEQIDAIKQSIENSSKTINIIINEAQENLKNYEKFSLQSDENKKQLDVLKRLPSTDSELWKSFIIEASSYSKEIEDSKKNCIYCLQPLDSNALDVVNAYSKYLTNESAIKLEETK